LKISSSYVPGSEEAKKNGCTCRQNDDGSFDINRHCPLHWHMSLVQKTEMIFQHILQQDRIHGNLLKLLLILVVFVLFLQFFKTIAI